MGVWLILRGSEPVLGVLLTDHDAQLGIQTRSQGLLRAEVRELLGPTDQGHFQVWMSFEGTL